jgi:hypothetical protein
MAQSRNSLTNPVWWDALPDVSTWAWELQAFDYFNERNFKSDDYLSTYLIVDLWRIVFDYFIHESRYVSLPIRIFHEINDGSSFSHFVIDAEPLLKHFFTRFYGIDNGNPVKLLRNDYGETPITVFGHCNLYISEFYFRPLRILQLGLEPNARLLFKFEPRKRVWPRRKRRFSYHLWPTCGKVFSKAKSICDFIVETNPKGVVWMSWANCGTHYSTKILDFLESNGSVNQRVDYILRHLNGEFPEEWKWWKRVI